MGIHQLTWSGLNSTTRFATVRYAFIPSNKPWP